MFVPSQRLVIDPSFTLLVGSGSVASEVDNNNNVDAIHTDGPDMEPVPQSTGLIVGVVFVVLIVVAAFVGGAVFMLRRRRADEMSGTM